MGLIARALESDGLPCAVTSWQGAILRLVRPPRSTATRLKRGQTLGCPGDAAQQIRVLKATLALLEEPASGEPVWLEESCPQ